MQHSSACGCESHRASQWYRAVIFKTKVHSVWEQHGHIIYWMHFGYWEKTGSKGFHNPFITDRLLKQEYIACYYFWTGGSLMHACCFKGENSTLILHKWDKLRVPSREALNYTLAGWNSFKICPKVFTFPQLVLPRLRSRPIPVQRLHELFNWPLALNKDLDCTGPWGPELCITSQPPRHY